MLWWIIGGLLFIGAAAIGYFVLWMKTYGERAWAGPGQSEIPLWRWIIRKLRAAADSGKIDPDAPSDPGAATRERDAHRYDQTPPTP